MTKEEQKEAESKKIFQTLNPNKVWIPVLIGMGIVAYLFYSDPNMSANNLKLVFNASVVSILLAVIVLLIRDVGYVYRIRTLTGKKLSWKSSIQVILLWEFASAVTPSAVGGTAVAIFILLKEGIKFGKSLAYVMVTAIFDNLFFVVAAPIVFLLAGSNIFSDLLADNAQFKTSFSIIFLVSYSLIAAYTLIMSYALFMKPRAFKWIMIKIARIRFMKRWRHAAVEQGNEMLIASKELKGRSLSFWVKISLSTTLIWCSRYAMLNCLIAAFTEITFAEHLIVFAKQIVMWIIMLISPTPGSSGTAEYSFQQFFTVYLAEYTLVANICWRLLSYYLYLFLGAIILPRWIKRVFFKKNKLKKA